MNAWTLRALMPGDQDRVRAFITEQWSAPIVVGYDHIHEPHTLPGFVAVEHQRWIGLITYHVAGAACEIVTLDSLVEGQGVGTALIDAVVNEARRLGCRRVWLITTNDNLHALRFYQKRGFRIVAVHRGAVDRARQIKSSIPLIGNDGIPLHDEIELELMLDQNL
jgi:GNAT superfamily N-acetyltransferase